MSPQKPTTNPAVNVQPPQPQDPRDILRALADQTKKLIRQGEHQKAMAALDQTVGLVDNVWNAMQQAAFQRVQQELGNRQLLNFEWLARELIAHDLKSTDSIALHVELMDQAWSASMAIAQYEPPAEPSAEPDPNA